MKKFILIIGTAVILSSGTVSAKEKTNDIFKENGFNKAPLTLSKGEFNEFFTNEEVVQIGTVLLNTKTNKIVAFLDEDTTMLSYQAESSSRWLSPDPLAEKYPSVSPYVYCANNPLKYIDPNGMDIWNMNTYGYFTRIEDKTQDRFNIVNNEGKTIQDKDGNDRSISFKYGTVQNVTEKNVKVNGEAKTLTLFDIKGDDNAKSLFEFIANPGETTNVEWSHDKVGSENSEKNIISTIHDKSRTVGGYYLTKNGYTIKEDTHSHPTNPEPSPADMNSTIVSTTFSYWPLK